MADLVTLARAKVAIPTATSADDANLAILISAASVAVERWTLRTFALAEYREKYDGDGTTELWLAKYPVTKLVRLAASPVDALTVSFDANLFNAHAFGANVSSATARVDESAFVLRLPVLQGTVLTISEYSIAFPDDSITEDEDTVSGFSTTTVLSTTKSLSNLATAIVALDPFFHSLSATVADNLGTLPLTSLDWPDGPKDIFNSSATFRAYVESLPGSMIADATAGRVVCDGFPKGIQNIMARYYAGYATIPEDVQEATSQLVSKLWHQAKRDPSLMSERLGDYSYSTLASGDMDGMGSIRRMLSRYKRYD